MLTREVQEEEGDEADQAIPEDEQPTRPQLTQAQRLLALRLAHGNPSQSDLQTARHLPWISLIPFVNIEGSRIS